MKSLTEKRHLYTTRELFTVIMDEIKADEESAAILKAANIDYALPTSDPRELRDYAFDVLGCVNYGSSEGIYVDLFYRGDIGGEEIYPNRKQGQIGTIKTLDIGECAFRAMAALMAEFQIHASRFLNTHRDDLEWTGYSVSFYKPGCDESFYGYTYKGAVKSFAAFEKEVKEKLTRMANTFTWAEIRENATGKVKRVNGDAPVPMRFFRVDFQQDNTGGGILDFGLCIRGVREPSISEAEQFVKENVLATPHILENAVHVTYVTEISHEEAESTFDMRGEGEWPVFALHECYETAREGGKADG